MQRAVTVRRLAGALLPLALAACGSAAAEGPVLGVTPMQSLLRIDQLAAPGFTVYTPAHAVTLHVNGLQAAAAVRYTRQEEFATANGPLDVSATVERFSAGPPAAAAFGVDVQALDAARGAQPVSTGPLGDSAHADTVVRATAGGLHAVQITLEWRVANLLNVLVIRGRQGGTRVQDALTLALAENVNELGPAGNR